MKKTKQASIDLWFPPYAGQNQRNKRAKRKLVDDGKTHEIVLLDADEMLQSSSVTGLVVTTHESIVEDNQVTQSSTTQSSTTQSSTTQSSTTQSSTTQSLTTQSSTTQSLTTQSLTSPVYKNINHQQIRAQDLLLSMLPRNTRLNDYTFAAVLNTPTEFIKALEILKEIFQILYVRVTPHCISTDSIDKSQTMVVYMWLERPGFAMYYHCDDDKPPAQQHTYRMCLKVSDLAMHLRGMGACSSISRNTSSMTLFNDRAHIDKMGVWCGANEKGANTTKYIQTLRLPMQRVIYSNIHLVAAIQLESAVFRSSMACMKTPNRDVNVSFQFMFIGDIDSNEPNVGLRPMLTLSGGSPSSPAITDIEKVCFFAPTQHESQQDCTARMILENAEWRMGCMPRRDHLKPGVAPNTWCLPLFQYNIHMLSKIASAQHLDQKVVIYVDVRGALIIRYNMKTLGTIVFIVTPNTSIHDDKGAKFKEVDDLGVTPQGAAPDSCDDSDTCDQDDDDEENLPVDEDPSDPENMYLEDEDDQGFQDDWE